MPFKSKAQMRWMYANHPEMAKRWAKHTENVKSLPEKKKEEKTAEVSAVLFKLAAEMWAKRIGNNLKVPLPLSVNPKKSVLGVNPAQQNSLLTSNTQYGAGAQQAVQQKANQIAQQQTQPQKMAFLKKLAQGGMGQTWAAHSAKIVPPQHSKPVATVENEIAKVPEEQVKQQTQGIVENIKKDNQDNLAQTGFLNRLTDPQNVSLETRKRFNAFYPLMDPVAKREFESSNQPVSSQMIQDYMSKDQQRFDEFLAEHGYSGKPYDWQKALTADASEAAPGPMPNFNPNYGALQQSSGGLDTEAQQQKRLAEEWVNNRIQSSARQGYNIPLVQALQSNQEKREQDQRALGQLSKRWTGIDETNLARLGGTIPEDLKVKARSGDQAALEQIKQLERHYANRGIMGYAGDIGGIGWDMLNSNLGMLAGGFAGAGFKTLGRAGAGAVGRYLPRVAPAVEGTGNVLGGLAKGYGSYSTQSGLATEGLTPFVGEERARNIANTALIGGHAARSSLNFARSLATGGGFLPSLGQAALEMTPTAFAGKSIFENLPALKQDLNPLSTQVARNKGYFDVLKQNNPGAISDALNASFAVSPQSMANAPIDQEAFNALPQNYPGHMAFENVDSIVKTDPRFSDFSAKITELNKIQDPQQRQAARSQLNGQISSNLGVSLDELEYYNANSSKLNQASQSLANAMGEVSSNPFMRSTDNALKTYAGDKTNPIAKKYVEALQNYEAVARETTEKSLPFLSKFQEHQYKKQIAPIEKELPAIAEAAQKATSDRLKGIITPEGEQVIQKAREFQSVARNHSYNSAMLALMKNGVITKADVDLKLGKDPQAAMKTIENLFKGGGIAKTIQTEGYSTSPYTGQPVPNSQFTDQMAKDTLEAEGKRNVASSANAQSGNQLTQNPGMWSKLTNEIWGKMQPWEKVLTLGGLSLGTIGLFSSMTGSDSDEDEEDSGGSYLPLLGIAAGLAAPAARYFGFNNTKA